MPQQSILAHNKTVLFVTHVGNNGIKSALWPLWPFMDTGGASKSQKKLFALDNFLVSWHLGTTSSSLY